MPLTEIEIRDATKEDLPRIFEIYNREVEQGISTFDVEPRRAGADDGWLTDRADYHPVLVAIDDSGSVAGWASTGPWSPRGAYRRTGEVSVYVDPDARGAGIGGRLLSALVERARETPEIAVLLARVAQPNPASVRIHEAAGFRSFGTQRRCGEKFGRILDVNLMDLHLDAEAPDPLG
jgi:L-amino acid N-acyltransferase YncA